MGNSYDQVLNANIHVGLHVLIILFTFQITGSIKNIILVMLANKKLDVVSHTMTEESESSLFDTNAYMAITFYQAILAFCLQDGPEAFTQYLYVDKYLDDFNLFNAAATIVRVLMSSRTMFIFFRFINGYIDPAYHSFRVRCFLWTLIGVKFVIFCAHGLRSIAVLTVNQSSATKLDCIRWTENSEMRQTPWNSSCLDAMDTALLVLSCLSVMGVGFGLFVAYKYGNKVFNQSHTSGREATVFMAREMRKTIEQMRKTVSSTVLGGDMNNERNEPRVRLNQFRPTLMALLR